MSKLYTDKKGDTSESERIAKTNLVCNGEEVLLSAAQNGMRSVFSLTALDYGIQVAFEASGKLEYAKEYHRGLEPQKISPQTIIDISELLEVPSITLPLAAL